MFKFKPYRFLKYANANRTKDGEGPAIAKIEEAFRQHYKSEETEGIGVDAGHVCFMPAKDNQKILEEFSGLERHHQIWRALDYGKMYDFNGLFGFFRANGLYVVSFDYVTEKYSHCGVEYDDTRVAAVRFSLYGMPTLQSVQYACQFNDQIVVVSDSCYTISREIGAESPWYEKSAGFARFSPELDWSLQQEKDGIVMAGRQTWEFEQENGLRGIGCSSGYGDGGYSVDVEVVPYFENMSGDIDSINMHVSALEKARSIPGIDLDGIISRLYQSVPVVGSVTVTFIDEGEDEDCDDDDEECDD